MIAIIGILSKKEYVRGERSFCWRTLHEKYPSKPAITKGERIYPEPLLVVNV